MFITPLVVNVIIITFISLRGTNWVSNHGIAGFQLQITVKSWRLTSR